MMSLDLILLSTCYWVPGNASSCGSSFSACGSPGATRAIFRVLGVKLGCLLDRACFSLRMLYAFRRVLLSSPVTFLYPCTKSDVLFSALY